jgi:hypothetical protein
MPYSVGIGTVTYNRKDIVNQTIDRVRAFTRRPNKAPVGATSRMHQHFTVGARHFGLPPLGRAGAVTRVVRRRPFGCLARRA